MIIIVEPPWHYCLDQLKIFIGSCNAHGNNVQNLLSWLGHSDFISVEIDDSITSISQAQRTDFLEMLYSTSLHYYLDQLRLK